MYTGKQFKNEAGNKISRQVECGTKQSLRMRDKRASRQFFIDRNSNSKIKDNRNLLVQKPIQRLGDTVIAAIVAAGVTILGITCTIILKCCSSCRTRRIRIAQSPLCSDIRDRIFLVKNELQKNKVGEEGNVYGNLFLLFVDIKEFLKKYGGNDEIGSEIDGFITNLRVIINSGAHPNMDASVREKYISILDNILDMLTTKVEV